MQIGAKFRAKVALFFYLRSGTFVSNILHLSQCHFGVFLLPLICERVFFVFFGRNIPSANWESNRGLVFVLAIPPLKGSTLSPEHVWWTATNHSCFPSRSPFKSRATKNDTKILSQTLENQSQIGRKCRTRFFGLSEACWYNTNIKYEGHLDRNRTTAISQGLYKIACVFQREIAALSYRKRGSFQARHKN